MPPYNWLLRHELNLGSLQAKLRALRTAGTPYSETDIENALTSAREQAAGIANRVADSGGPPDIGDKEIVALVAYLQRLGADLKASTGTQP